MTENRHRDHAPNYTLCTGATGLLGQSLLIDLLEARLPVAVLVRDGREARAADRIEHQLRRCEEQFQVNLPRPVIITGELTAAGLGLSGQDRSWLARHTARVVHSAAMLSFKPAASHPRNEPYTTNVEGTRRLADFCVEAGISEFHYVSSAFTCGQRNGRILETDGDAGQTFSNDYECSKLQAEELLHQMPSLDVTVYRPSIVVDPRPGSVQIGDRTIYLAFSVYQMLAQRVGLPEPRDLLHRLGLRGDERKNIVPVDWVSRVIVQIMRRPALHQRTYHLTNPQGTALIDLVTAFQQVLAEAGHSRLSRPLVESDFGDFAGVVDQFVQTFAPYFRDDPVFDQTQLQQALSVCDEPGCPDMVGDSLREIARQQLARRTPPASASKVSMTTSWRRFLSHSQPQAIGATTGLTTLGLLLSGSEGGDWLVSLDERGEVQWQPGGGESAAWIIYATAATWDDLLRDRKSLADVLEQGRLMLQTQKGHDLSEKEAINQINRLVEAVRAQGTAFQEPRRVMLYER